MGLTQPQVTTQIAFQNNPLTPLSQLTWTDVSRDVVSITCSRGRQHELSQAEAGRATIRLRNDANQYSPFNTSSPNYGPFTDNTFGNMLSAVNSSFETGSGGWSGRSAVASSVTATALDGTHSLQIGTFGGGGGPYGAELAGTVVLPNTAYTAMAWVQASSTAAPCTLTLTWYDAGTALISSTSVTQTSTTVGWVQLLLHATSPSNAAYGWIAVTSPVASIYYIDQAGLFLGGTVNTWTIGGGDSNVSGLVPMKRVRVQAKWAGVTTTIWTGFVESWTNVWPDEATNYMDVVCVDAFKLLNLRKTATGTFALEVARDTPTAWWRLNDATGSGTAVDATGNRYDIAYLGAPTLGVAGLLAGDSSTATTFSRVVGQVATTTGASERGAVITGYPFTVEAWFQTGPSPAEFKKLLEITGRIRVSVVDSSGVVGAFVVGDAGKIGVEIAGATLFTGVSSIRVDDGKPHHLAVVVLSYSTMAIYVDGVDVTSISQVGSVGPLPYGNYFKLGIGNSSPAASNFGYGFHGQLQDVVVYNSQLTPERVVAHYQAGATAWNLDTPGTRINRVLDALGWPAADRDIDTGSSPIQTAQLSGQGGLSHAQAVTATENGLLFQGGDGRVKFYGRTHTLLAPTSTSSQVTLSDAGGEPWELAGSQIVLDDLDLWNDVTVQRTGGVVQRAQDATSQARYGVRGLARSGTLDATDFGALDQATYLLSRYSAPLQRAKSVTVHPMDDPANLFPQVLQRELLDRMTIARQPFGSPVTYSQVSDIEFVQHTITPDDWHTLWRLSPSDTKQYWVLGDSVLGVLDSTTKLFY